MTVNSNTSSRNDTSAAEATSKAVSGLSSGFMLDGNTYKLPANDGANTLHGGTTGFDKVVWHAEPFEREGERGIVLTYTSPDGDQGFPGTLESRVTYTLTDKNELAFDYQASNADTLCPEYGEAVLYGH